MKQKTIQFPADTQVIDGGQPLVISDVLNEYMETEGKGWEIKSIIPIKVRRMELSSNTMIQKFSDDEANHLLILLEAPDLTYEKSN